MSYLVPRTIQRPTAPDGGTTGAPAAGVPLAGVGSGNWFGASSFIES